MECTKAPPGVRKAKKKQVKDELDRHKQAEKKRRRLEKALATSAAIRSELEKKKQKKIEEQQRLDEEGAAIAEAVALHVLLGEDSEDSCKIMLKRDEGFNPWDCAGNIDLFMGGTRVVLPHQDLSKHSLEGRGWVPCAHGSGCKCNEWVNIDRPVSPGPFGLDLYTPYSDDRVWETTEISAGHIAAQAVASLQIAEDAHVDSYVFNRMLRGSCTKQAHWRRCAPNRRHTPTPSSKHLHNALPVHNHRVSNHRNNVKSRMGQRGFFPQLNVILRLLNGTKKPPIASNC